MNPEGSHFTLCPLQVLGFDFCPGCGLGRSCALLLNGQLEDSFYRHPMGIFAIPVIVFRIIQLLRDRFFMDPKSNVMHNMSV